MNSLTRPELARIRPMETMVEREIQIRAYELYAERGKGQGFALEDWLKAEAEILARPAANGVTTKANLLPSRSQHQIHHADQRDGD